MQIIIRNTALSDAGAVNRLSKQLGYSLKVADTYANIQRLLSTTNNCCFVATFDSIVVGWIHGLIAFQIESNPFAVVGGLVVDEAFRGKGIGKKLIDEVKQWSGEKNVETLRLRCNVKRMEVHCFYEHIGFAVTKEQKVFELQLDKK